jgi:opacity protein-like surface antigen
MAYTFGTYVALNAEYEYADYTKGAFTSRGSVYSAQNDEIKYNMKAQHTVRVGAELNVDGFAARLGYNYMTAPFVNGAYKELYNASVTETSTDYMNRFDKSVITSGIGFHGKMLYFDLAYALEMQKAEFYPFYDFEVANPGAAVTMANHSVVATLGMRF